MDLLENIVYIFYLIKYDSTYKFVIQYYEMTTLNFINAFCLLKSVRK